EFRLAGPGALVPCLVRLVKVEQVSDAWPITRIESPGDRRLQSIYRTLEQPHYTDGSRENVCQTATDIGSKTAISPRYGCRIQASAPASGPTGGYSDQAVASCTAHNRCSCSPRHRAASVESSAPSRTSTHHVS